MSKLIGEKWDFDVKHLVLKAPEDGTGNVPENEPTEQPQEEEVVVEKPPEDPDKPWRNPKVEQRISDLTKQRYAAEAKARELEAKLAALDTNKKPVQIDPNDIPLEILNAKLAELRFVEKSNELFKKGSGKFGDFPAIVNEVKTALGGYPTGVIEAALELDNPEEVLYHLGKDLGTAGDIFSLPPARQGAALARFAAGIEKVQVNVSKAPPPIKPVDGRVSKEFTAENTELPIDQWIKARQAQAKKR